MMPSIKYTFMENIYDINSNLVINNNRVDTTQFRTNIALQDLYKISIVTALYTAFIIVTLLSGQLSAREFLITAFGYIVILIQTQIFSKVLENQKITINSYTSLYKFIILSTIEISSLINLIFLEGHCENLCIIRSLYFEYIFIFFLTVLLKLEDYGYCILWLINFYFTCWLESRLPGMVLNLEKFLCVVICISSVMITRDTRDRLLKNYIIHKKTQRYIDHLINKMFCLFLAWNDNKFVFINKSAKNFINNKFDTNDQDTSPDDDNYDVLCKDFLSSIRFTYLNKELHKDQDLKGFTLLNALKSFEKQDRTQNHDLYFIGVIEYIHPTVKDKYYFNVFFRSNMIANIKWIEIFMYDITLSQRIETIDQTIKIKEKILSKIAHEFKTPLICVVSLSEKLQSDIKAMQVQSSFISEIKQINDLSNYTLLLINDIAFYLNSNAKLLDGVLSNINNNKFYESVSDQEDTNNQIILHKEDVYVIDILKFVFRILETLMIYKGNSNISPIKDFKSGISHLVIHTDPLRLKQILLNLVSNAVKFTKSGFIRLSARIHVDENYNKELIISVEDSGNGIKEEDLDKLFKDFQMFDRKINTNAMGSGLGLSISNQLANLMGYKISVVSKYTAGSTFSLAVKLPPYQLNPPRKQSCPIFKQKTIFKINNCKFTNNFEEKDAMNIFESNKKNIKRLLSGYITTVGWRKSRRSYLPFNTNIVHISNSNFNFNNYDKEERTPHPGIELISNQDSSSSDIDDVQILGHKTDTDNADARTVEMFYPVNMDEVRKTISLSYINEGGDFPRRSRHHSRHHSSKNKLSSKFSSEKRNIIVPTFPVYSKEIVIVDDNSMLLATLKNIIVKVLHKSKATDVKVTCGNDGIDLLKVIIDDQKRDNIVKLVFVDEYMDYMNGSEAIKILRELENKNKIKPLYIVKVSAMNFDKSLDGSDLILEKPARENQIKVAMIQAGIIKSDQTNGLPSVATMTAMANFSAEVAKPMNAAGSSALLAINTLINKELV
jgi:signal transduction histidine kinase/CheY-like chemotaxis protein